MTPQQFIAKWREAQLSERSAYQQHFCDLCDLSPRRPKPADADPAGTHYTFERGVTTTDDWGAVEPNRLSTCCERIYRSKPRLDYFSAA